MSQTQQILVYMYKVFSVFLKHNTKTFGWTKELWELKNVVLV